MATLHPLSSSLASTGAPVTLQDIDITAQLHQRHNRPPDYEREDRAMAMLIAEMADNPRNMLQKLAEVAVDLCDADTGGVSLLEGNVFRWEAIAGAFADLRYGTMPREASPCGVCIDRDQTQLMYLADRLFPAMPVQPRIIEALLVPFHHRGEAIGTVWMVTHRPQRRFDREDSRILNVLAQFASGAWQLWKVSEASDEHRRLSASSNELLTRILASLPASIVVVLDRQLRYRFAAGGGLARFDLTPGELMGRSIAEAWGQLTEDMVAPFFARAFDGECVTFDMGFGGRMLQISAAPYDVDHQATIIVLSQDISEETRHEEAVTSSEMQLATIIRSTEARVHVSDADHRPAMVDDVTSRKRSERAPAEAARQEELAAVLAHELRQPLSAVSAAIAVMQRCCSPSSVERAQTIIERQVDHMRRLTDDLLDSLRVAKNKIVFRRQRVDLNEAVRDAAAAAEPLLASRHQRFTLNLPDEPVMVEGDPDRLVQVVSNLLTNAARYTQDGGNVALRLAPDGTRVEVRVLDNGQGIAPERLRSVFDLFAQASDRDEGGLGVGLALVRRLVQRHGGTIEARSEGKGQGSEFIVTLPVCDMPSHEQ